MCDLKHVWLIEGLWTDPLENTREHAMGYELLGYVLTEEAADSLVTKGGLYSGSCWAVAPATPMRRKTKLHLIT